MFQLLSSKRFLTDDSRLINNVGLWIFSCFHRGAATEHGTSAHGDCIALIIHNHSCKSCTRQPHSGTVFLRLNPTTTLSQLSCMRLSPSRLIQVRCSECPLTLSHNLRNGIIQQQLQLILLEHICSLEGWIAKYCNKEIKKYKWW